MKSTKRHNAFLIRWLAVLCGVFFFSLLPIESDPTDFSLSQLAEVENHYDKTRNAEGEPSSQERTVPESVSDLILKETPKQEQPDVASHNPPVIQQGHNPPEPDSKDVSSERSLLYKALMLLPEEYTSSFVFRLTLYLFSQFFSLPGDIAINAP